MLLAALLAATAAAACRGGSLLLHLSLQKGRPVPRPLGRTRPVRAISADARSATSARVRQLNHGERHIRRGHPGMKLKEHFLMP